MSTVRTSSMPQLYTWLTNHVSVVRWNQLGEYFWADGLLFIRLWWRNQWKSGCYSQDAWNEDARWGAPSTPHNSANQSWIGLFLRASRDLLGANLISNGTNYTSSTLIYATELHNFDTNARFYVLRHNDATYVPSKFSELKSGLILNTSQFGELWQLQAQCDYDQGFDFSTCNWHHGARWARGEDCPNRLRVWKVPDQGFVFDCGDHDMDNVSIFLFLPRIHSLWIIALMASTISSCMLARIKLARPHLSIPVHPKSNCMAPTQCSTHTITPPGCCTSIMLWAAPALFRLAQMSWLQFSRNRLLWHGMHL